MSHRRTGKIAQLPRAVREQVNLMLDEGKQYQPIIDWLSANGHPGITHNNLTNWKAGGFQDWLELSRHLSEMEKLRELSYDIATANDGSKTQEAAIHLAAACLCRVLLKFDPAKLANDLEIKPAHFTTMLNSFTRLNRRSNELDMIKEYIRQQEDRRKEAEQTKVEGQKPKGLSDPTRAQIESEFNLR
jgi:hypothetical protein